MARKLLSISPDLAGLYSSFDLLDYGGIDMHDGYKLMSRGGRCLKLLAHCRVWLIVIV